MTPRSAAHERRDRVLRVVLPVIVLALSLAAWELVVRLANVPPYVLPAPSLILRTFIADKALLTQSLLVTLLTTLEGFLLAAIGGVGLAVLFNLSRLVEYSFYPFAVILQVTPIVAVAPLLLIYLPQPLAVLACAWIVAFFPVLANTTLGLNSIDRNLADLFVPRPGVVEPEAAVGAALHPRRPAHRRRAVADRRRGRRNRRRLRGRRLRPRLSHRRVGLSPQYSAHVRGPGAAIHRRDRDFLPASIR